MEEKKKAKKWAKLTCNGTPMLVAKARMCAATQNVSTSKLLEELVEREFGRLPESVKVMVKEYRERVPILAYGVEGGGE